MTLHFLLLVSCAVSVTAHNWLEAPASRNSNKDSTVKPCPPVAGDYQGVTVNPGETFEAKWTTNHDGDHWIKVVSKISESKLEQTAEVGPGQLEFHQKYENKQATGSVKAPQTPGTYVVQYGWNGYRNCVDLIVRAPSDTPTTPGGCVVDCGIAYGRHAECENGGCVCKEGYPLDDKLGICQDPNDIVDVNCESYCKDAIDNCVGSAKIYSSRAACLAACATFPVGRKGDRLGNTLHCRFHHLHVEGGDPEVHCPHSGPDGGGKCEGGDFLPGIALSVTADAGVTTAQLQTTVEQALTTSAMLGVSVLSVTEGEAEGSFTVNLVFADSGEEGGQTPLQVAAAFHASTQAQALKKAVEDSATVQALTIHAMPKSATASSGGSASEDIGAASTAALSWMGAMLVAGLAGLGNALQ